MKPTRSGGDISFCESKLPSLYKQQFLLCSFHRTLKNGQSGEGDIECLALRRKIPPELTSLWPTLSYQNRRWGGCATEGPCDKWSTSRSIGHTTAAVQFVRLSITSRSPPTLEAPGDEEETASNSRVLRKGGRHRCALFLLLLLLMMHSP